MKIQFDQKSFNVVDKKDRVLKSFPLRSWEVEYDALGKIQAIDYIKEKLNLTVLDYSECYERIRVSKK